MDASSMYEQARAEEVFSVAEALAQELRDKCVRGLLVQRCRSLKGRHWRHGGVFLAEHACVSIDVMITVLRCCLCVMFTHVGDIIYDQAKGLPIGGPSADLGAALAFGVNESRSRFAPPPKLREDFDMLPAGMARLASLMQVRYVDVVLALSNSLCAPVVRGVSILNFLNMNAYPFHWHTPQTRAPFFGWTS